MHGNIEVCLNQLSLFVPGARNFNKRKYLLQFLDYLKIIKFDKIKQQNMFKFI